jgi:hypothetical protein
MRVIHGFDFVTCNLYQRQARLYERWPVSRNDWVTTRQSKKQAIAMYHTTGFTSDELVDICVLITSADCEPSAAKRPPCLGLLNSVVATLAYLRHNRTQVEIAESLGVPSPPSAGRSR